MLLGQNAHRLAIPEFDRLAAPSRDKGLAVMTDFEGKAFIITCTIYLFDEVGLSKVPEGDLPVLASGEYIGGARDDIKGVDAAHALVVCTDPLLTL